MKKQQLFIFLTLLLLSLLIRFNLGSLPFLHGKYIYWLFFIIGGSTIFLFQNWNKNWVLNQFDICVFTLSSIGLWNFMCISNAKISNLKVWYIIAYLLLYAILRRTLNTKENVLEISKKIYYLIFIIASLNAVIAILQKTQLLSCSNNYFQVTGLFFSPNHMGLFLVIGILSLIELIKENKSQLNKILFLSFFVILAYSLYLSKCRGAYLALIIAILCNMINSRKENKKTFFYKKTLYALLILSTLITMLWSTNRFKSESVSGRFFIIKQSLMELANRPFTGYGFDSFSLQYNLAKADYFAIERSWEETRNAGYIYNANNDFLELSFELGMIWIVVFFIFIIMLLSKANKSNTSKASSSMLLCIIIFAFTNTIQSIPLLVVLGCIFTVSIINESETKKIILFKQTNLFKIIAIISLITFSTIIVLRLNAEYRLRKIYNAEEISSVQKTENFISKIDANGEQLFMAGIICIKSNNQEKGFRYLINGFKLSGKPSLGKNLARIFERMGNYAEAEKIYIYNRNVEPFRFDARIDLFNLYLKSNQKEKAVKTANEILYLPVKIPSSKIHLFKQNAKYYLEKQKKKAV